MRSDELEIKIEMFHVFVNVSRNGMIDLCARYKNNRKNEGSEKIDDGVVVEDNKDGGRSPWICTRRKNAERDGSSDDEFAGSRG